MNIMYWIIGASVVFSTLAYPLSALYLGFGVSVYFLVWKILTLRHKNLKKWTAEHWFKWSLATGAIVGIPAVSLQVFVETIESHRTSECGEVYAFDRTKKVADFNGLGQVCADNFYSCNLSSTFYGWNDGQKEDCYYRD